MKNITRLADVARLLVAAHPQLRLTQLMILLAVAEGPGRTQTEVAEDVGLSISAMSRAVDVLGKSGRRDQASKARLGWIEAVADPIDDRRLMLHLLPEGRQLVKMIEGQMA